MRAALRRRVGLLAGALFLIGTYLLPSRWPSLLTPRNVAAYLQWRLPPGSSFDQTTGVLRQSGIPYFVGDHGELSAQLSDCPFGLGESGLSIEFLLTPEGRVRYIMVQRDPHLFANKPDGMTFEP